jgi:hypothetical protein
VRAHLIVISALFASSAHGADPLRFPLPKGALEPGHVALQPGLAEQDHFFLNEKYPGSSALSHYARIFSKWRACYWPQRDWETIPDASSDPARLLHRRVRFWVAPTNTEWVMVTLQYTSPGLTERALPVNDRQFVVVATRKTHDAEEDLGLLDAKCDEPPNNSLERTRAE